MKCVMVMFDSLNRHLLPAYNNQTPAHTPNFARLAKQAATFDRSYVCSMPCMPARRDFHTGRPNFLHTSWGPLEPYDDSVPQMLSGAGVYTHLTTDHYHYAEDGGATYHGRYDSWQLIRGQEGDPCIGQVAAPPIPDNVNGKGSRSDWINRQHFKHDADAPQTQTFNAGLDFINRNADEDNWFLQIECFDPHEPFVVDRSYKELYPSDYDGPLFDWPPYDQVSEPPEQIDEARRNYAALMSKCDASLGQVMHMMDRHGMWEDTMLIVWTDHGFMLGEHGCWAKNWMPLYEEISHTPFFIHDPRSPNAGGERRGALVQPSIDLGPTLLGFFGLKPTERMLGHDLGGTVANDYAVRDAAIFGYFGQHLNLIEDQYAYYRDAVTSNRSPLNRYTLMPTDLRSFVSGEQLRQATLAPPFDFTCDMPLLKWPIDSDLSNAHSKPKHLLFDLDCDPTQQTPLDDPATTQRLCTRMAELLTACEAPAEQYQRLGLSPFNLGN